MKKLLLSSFMLTSLALSLLQANVFEKRLSKENVDAMKNKKIECRWVCDKKLYKEQKIEEAISFYKNSKDYHFSKKEW